MNGTECSIICTIDLISFSFFFPDDDSLKSEVSEESDPQEEGGYTATNV